MVSGARSSWFTATEWHAENLSAGSEPRPGPGYGMTEPESESDQPVSRAGLSLETVTEAGHALRPPPDTWHIDPACLYYITSTVMANLNQASKYAEVNFIINTHA